MSWLSPLLDVRSPRGQGLLEAVIAIGVIVTGIIGALALTTSSISTTTETESRLVATNLAREGIEVVRLLRDSNWLAGKIDVSGSAMAWDTGLVEQSGDVTAIAELDQTTFKWSLNFTPTDSTDLRTLLYRASGVYRQSTASLTGATATPYARIINLYAICQDFVSTQISVLAKIGACNPVDNKIGIRVVSVVAWSEHGQTKKVQLEDWLYNWRFASPTYVP